MFTDVREQVRAEFAECHKPAGCVQAGPALLIGPVETRRGIAAVAREVATNLRRIVAFPGRQAQRPLAG